MQGFVRQLAAVAASVLGTVVVVAPTGCRAILGIDDRQLLHCGPTEFASEACASCVAASCCAEEMACSEDEACAESFACLAGCQPDDGGCQSNCDRAYVMTQGMAALRACLASACSADCGLRCGGLALVPANICDDACAQPCCALAETSAATLAHGLLRACQDACLAGDASCIATCQNDHAEGASLAEATSECVDASCGELQRWSCVGSIEAMTTAEDTITFSGTFLDVVDRMPIVNASIRACSSLSTTCQPSGAEATTDESGQAVLELPISNLTRTFDGYLELEVPGTYHLLFAPVPPYTTDVAFAYNAPSDAAIVAAAGTAGVAIDPQRGSVLLSAFDCSSMFASGVSIGLDPPDPDATVFYLDMLIPNIERTETDDAARGGIVNVKEGFATVTGSVASLCGKVAVVRAPVRAGWVTAMQLKPTAELNPL